jgi:hypothetical protein
MPLIINLIGIVELRDYACIVSKYFTKLNRGILLQLLISITSKNSGIVCEYQIHLYGA